MENNDKKQKNKIKNSLLTILLAVATVSVAVLMWIAIFGNGGGAYVIFESEENFENISFTQSNQGVVDNTTKANIKITSGDKFFVTSNGANGKETLECEIVDGTLFVNLQTKQDILGEFFQSDMSEIIISIPNDINIQSLNVNADLGFFTIENTACESFVFEGETTVANIFDCDFQTSKIQSQLGNIKCYDSNLGDFKFDGGTCNPEFKNCDFDDFDIYVKFGNILVQYASVQNVNLLADMGYVNMESITIAGDMKAYADYGAISLSIIGEPTDFAIVTRISESGKTVVNENIKQGKDETLQQLDISTYIGDINVACGK